MFDSSSFCSKNQFEDDNIQYYLMCQPIYRSFKKIGNSDHISGNLENYLMKALSLLLHLIIGLAPSLKCIGVSTRV